MKVPLYEVAILQKPTKKEVDEGTGTEKLVYGPKCVVARDDAGAMVAAMADGDKPTIDDINRIEVIVRPFVEPRR